MRCDAPQINPQYILLIIIIIILVYIFRVLNESCSTAQPAKTRFGAQLVALQQQHRALASRMLEDFFTPTEMEEGISTVARIGDLVSEMRELRDAVALNEADLLRRCSAAVNALAVTANEECLQHFVQLDGVAFLTKWFQDVQSCSKDSSSAAQDLMLAILTALDGLPDTARAPASCGVLLPTVQNLLVHANAEVSQKARVLCQKWSSVSKGCCTHDQDMDTQDATRLDRQLKDSQACQETENGEKDGANEPVIADDDESNGNAILGNDISVSSHGSSEKLLPYADEISAMNDVGLATSGMPRLDSLEAKSGAAQVAAPDMTTEAKSPEPNNSFLSTEMHVEDQNDPACLDDIKKDEPFSADVPHSVKDTLEDLNHLANVSHVMQDSSDEERFGKEEAPTSSSDSDAEGAINEYRFQRCMDSFGDSSKAADSKSAALNGDKSTPLAEYDDTDALEVARLVAIEVEREVIDYREPFCDSPDINSRDDSPDLVANQQPEPPIDESNDNKSSTTGNGSGSSSSLKEDGSGITDDTGPFTRKLTRSTELEDFDLNENQCPEETDWHTKSVLSNSVNLSTPIAVAASRASSVFPSRLHFEGEHGWKGSAATSAFRPASPRRNFEGDKSILASSQKASNMFDLNLADSDNAIAEEPRSAAIFPTSGLASKDKSAALAVSWGFELDLNGPCDNEEAAVTKTDVPLFWNRRQFAGTISQPPSSSSSRQPAVNNFDLNDNMSNIYGSSRAVNEFSAKASGKETSGSSEVTILGKRILVGQQEHRHQIQHNFLGPSMESRVHTRPMQSYAHAPPSVESYPYLSALSFPGPMMSLAGGPYMVDARGDPVMPSLLGSGVGVSHPSFSSRAIPPSSTELSYFHPSMGFSYGPSSEGVRREDGGYWPVSFQGQNMFGDERMRNMSQGSGSTSSGVAPKRREPDSGWDLFQGQNMFVDERMRDMSQGGGSTSSGVAPKRKEADLGWDLFSRR
jgi:hypothetical protein